MPYSAFSSCRAVPCFSIALLSSVLGVCGPGIRSVLAQPFPGTEPLTLEGDIASELVAGVDRFLLKKVDGSVAARAKYWKRDFSDAASYDTSIQSNRERLAHILGLRDSRADSPRLEYDAAVGQPSLVARSESFDIHRIRWRAFAQVYGEGLLLQPRTAPRARVVAIPHSDQTPEDICGLGDGVPPERQYARRLAESGCLVVVPTLVSRGRGEFTWHGRSHGIAHREFLYRSAYEVGRHIIGYELQKILAVVDWFSRQAESGPTIGVCGYGDGGMLALYAAALDSRIGVACVSGYFENRNEMWRQPIDRNVFSLLEQFGDAELAAMVAPRRLVIDASAHPGYELPPGTGGAPARIVTPALAVVQDEVSRASSMLAQWEAAKGWLQLEGDGTGDGVSTAALIATLGSVSPAVDLAPESGATLEKTGVLAAPKARLERQMREMDRHTQSVLRDSMYVRDNFMSRLDFSGVAAYEKSVEEYREIFRHEVIGHFDDALLPPKPRTRKLQEVEGVTFYEVVLDVFPDVIAYGILCLPEGLEDGERRPAIVCQHGLEGRPQSVIGEKEHQYYKAFATELAKRGFVTFAPQNLYIFRDRFRTLQRKAYPLKKTLFSVIVPQHQQIVDWLQSLSFVDPERVAFYGLSYGGKTAMRVPPLVTDYCLSICSADFNEWVDKNASTRHRRSYVWGGEYEIFEWDLGSTFNYAEMAALIAPRPFMVERGHYDGVADDWTVGWEFARVRFLYQGKLKLGDRCEIEWFDGPHAIHGVGTYRFLHKHLRWPEPGE